MTPKCRYVVLTDVNPGPETDDTQSLTRLLLYADEIDIEGLIVCTSCFQKKRDLTPNAAVVYELLDRYNRIHNRLLQYSVSYPSAQVLRERVACGIPRFGKRPGKGFAEERWIKNDGVRLLIEAFLKEDARPLWIGLWGGANTLAEALWTAQREFSPEVFSCVLKKLRIYSISDQDNAGKWIRKTYGDALFYIVSPSKGTFLGSREYYKATWPGISADCFAHGSEDGIHRTNGFTGADRNVISEGWIDAHIRCGEYGSFYPKTKYITEGDTPAFSGLLQNGLNVPEHPEYGGWGGRYTRQKPQGEPHSIYTNAADTVTGADGKLHTSPQATIWRWRTDFQNDFAARIARTLEDASATADPTPVIITDRTGITAVPGQCVTLHPKVRCGVAFKTEWFFYPEAGFGVKTLPELITETPESVSFTAPDIAGTDAELHLILRAVSTAETPVARYCRYVIHLRKTTVI